MSLSRVKKEEFQVILDEDAEFTDSIIDKLSQLKILKEEVEKNQPWTEHEARRKFATGARALQSPSRGLELESGHSHRLQQ